MSPARRLLAGLVVASALVVSDGGTRLSAPAGPGTARPPLPGGTTIPEEGIGARGVGEIRVLEALARALVRDPEDEGVAIRLARQAGRTDRLDWVEGFLRAAGRRTATAALALARAEAHYLRGEVLEGLADARRARRMRPESREAALAYAAGRAARGEVLLALGSLAPGHQVAGPTPAGLASRQRAAQLLALFEGKKGRPTPAWRTWVEWRRRGDPSGQGRALLLLATLERLAGRDGAARRATERALWMAIEAGDPMTTAMALSHSADLAPTASVRRARQSAACQVLREVGHEVGLDCLVSALESAWRDGRVVYALGLLDRIAPAVAGNAILELRLADTGIALLRATGRLLDAERLASAASRAAGRLLQPAVQAHHLTRLAILRRSRGRFQEAEDALEAAARVAPRDADLRVLGGLERFELAWSRGRVDRARAHLAASLSTHQGVGADLRLLVELQALRLELVGAPVARGAPDPTGSRDPAPRSVRPTPGPEALATLARGALRSEVEGDDLAAVRGYLQALRHLRDWTGSMRDPFLAALVADTWRVLGRRAVDLALEAGRVTEALEALELGRWRAVPPLLSLRAGPPPPGRDGATAGGSGPVAREGDAGRAVEADSPAPGARTGSTAGAHDNAWHAGDPWRAAIASVPDGSALLVYALGSRHAWGIVVRGRQAVPFRIGPSVDAVRARVGIWRQAALSGQTGLVEGTGGWLADALLGPAERAGLLDGVERIHVVPDGTLHGLSFAALPDGSGRVYGERFVWSRSPSLEFWRRGRGTPHRVGPTVAFGPRGGGATRAELAAAAAGPEDVSYAAGRATETRWHRAAGVAGVLHFAGHATAPDPGLRGGMLSLRPDGLRDGRLTLPEILGLPLDGAAIVLLGCDTVVRPGAPGGVGPAPELPSLSEAFLVAGARAVVGSLWPVREDVARELAVAFYRAGGPAAGPRALADAQQRLRKRWPGRPDRWAPAVWIGPPETLRPAGGRPSRTVGGSPHASQNGAK